MAFADGGSLDSISRPRNAAPGFLPQGSSSFRGPYGPSPLPENVDDYRGRARASPQRTCASSTGSTKCGRRAVTWQAPGWPWTAAA